MTREEWIAGLEAASGMSRQQMGLIGLGVKRLTCRRTECKGFHLVVAEEEGVPRIDRDDPDCRESP